MEIISERLVDNVIKNAVEELKKWKNKRKKLLSLSEGINENDNSSKKIINCFIKIFSKSVKN